MLKERLQELVGQAVGNLWPDKANAVGEIMIERPAQAQLGDYAVNIAFRLAKMLSLVPQAVAQAIADEIDTHKPSEIERIEVAGGYLNFFVTPTALQAELSTIIGKPLLVPNSGHDKTVIVEYPSTNIAKPMHYGHSRVIFIGDALANLYEACGYRVIRWDYLGDWGTQFGKLIAAYKMWGSKAEIEAKPIETMLALYVRFSAEAKDNAELEARAREEFQKLEAGDAENRQLWQWFKEESLKESHRMYEALGMHASDIDIGESFYEKDMKPLIAELLEKGIATQDEGAVIVPLESENLPNALLQKSDGASLYLTRDIANLRYRLETYYPAKILYVVANQQALHFEQLFAIAKLLGLTAAELEHIKFGLVLGANRKKLATREGTAVLLEDVVKEAISRAQQIVSQKNPDLPDDQKQEVARAVAIGALKYNDLKESRTSDIIFDWDRVLDFNGNSGPYLQYTYARLRNIVAKAGKYDTGNVSQLVEPLELELIKQLIDYGPAVTQACQLNVPHYLALYLYDLANLANQFYEKVRVLDDDNQSRRDARLMLIDLVAVTLKQGLFLLGIEVLEKI